MYLLLNQAKAHRFPVKTIRTITMNQIVQLNQADFPKIKTLLAASNLPYSDLEFSPVYFWGIKEDKKPVATGALEIYGAEAILRSLAVQKEFRNQGFGKQLTNFLEQKAAEFGIGRLFLLTTSAGDFFKRLGYQPAERNRCPEAILASPEFAELCPATALCMCKKL
ncbi:arsenic resistance N-acetyltransferase ArsN2 [Gaoshiqia sp. Z1-71]|uniref:arsenic resistance N-acetyltransferase ArsN2 n=1 Tax=Gaoshiqia hydrogeniformans TaxID=3290090 RepID=UPI003BF8318C